LVFLTGTFKTKGSKYLKSVKVTPDVLRSGQDNQRGRNETIAPSKRLETKDKKQSLVLIQVSCFVVSAGHVGLYETPAEALLLAVFQYSLWPDAALAPAVPVYKKLPPKRCC